MTPTLRDQLLDRLLESSLNDITMHLVEAACEGQQPLDEAMEALGDRPPRERPPPRPRPPDVEPPGAYLEGLEVAGFRGIGAPVTVELTPGPGLTLVVGRNGSGKSSIAEGLEMVLSGSSGRWKDRRSKLWKEGWRNLHAQELEVRLQARLVVEGSQVLTITRRWSQEDAPEGGALQVRDRAGAVRTLEELGWADALHAFRPFLSYPELGALVEQPSRVFDELWGLLGLEELTRARELLSEHKKAMANEAKRVKQEKESLKTSLSALDDPRAGRCVELLAPRNVDLDTLEATLAEDAGGATAEDRLGTLRALARLTPPAEERVAEVVGALRAALEARAALAGASAELNAKLADALWHAISYLSAVPGTCPVCERPLDDAFVQSATDRLERSRELAREARSADEALRAHRDTATSLFAPLVHAPLSASDVGLDEELAIAREALAAFCAMPASAAELPAHLETAGRDLAAAVGALASSARSALAQLEQAFKPVRQRVLTWLEAARAVEERAALEKHVKEAERWLSETEVELRNQRFEPIAERVRSIWDALGQTSHVVLERVSLAGRATKRHVDFDVTVDGHEAAAVAVMSQGELNALALSLFLPRMMLPDSPFRFLVIDDPVQAMDPVKVEGLARVLSEVARTRQVLVFTHDERLLEAVRRMRIPSTVLAVSRRASSIVEVEQTRGPVQQHLADAKALLAPGSESLDAEIVARLVPAFCRGALEAACVETVRRRRLGRGDRHDEVESALSDARTLMHWAALAFFDDVRRTGEVFQRANRFGRWAGDALRACKEGAHAPGADLPSLVEHTARLARAIEELS